ncbi:MAG: aminodeoxychorismate synthase component I [Sulfurovum sp.]|nr:aminodeoxychorismate synthase component I [Sulfurovum sp.]
MSWLDKTEGFERINTLGKAGKPFLFIVSYTQDKILAQTLDTLDKDIWYQLDGWHNTSKKPTSKPYTFAKSPLAFTAYKQALDRVQEQIALGNTYLLNYTAKTPIHTSLSLQEIFTHSKAKFKLYYKDEFTCFSPESFVEISNDTIATYPMKGTIDANIPHAKATILANPKELAEHIMIVDLMRNDLGIIGSNVKVEKFRYVEKIQAGEKSLLQVSSKITATLAANWKDTLGTLLSQILPAGSITGTPKKSTVSLIKTIEAQERGFYTGVFGIFDGKNVRSAVMIRFIAKEEKQLYYHSGGGITLDSDAQSEYEELLDKIYLPIHILD